MINRATKDQQAPGPVFPSTDIPVVTGRLDNSRQDPVNMTMLEQSLGNEGALVILQTFISFAAEIIVELQEAVRSKNCANASSALSELSNSCRVIGASSLLRSCILMEDELAKPDWERIEHSMSALIRESRTVGQFVSELLSQATDQGFSS